MYSTLFVSFASSVSRTNLVLAKKVPTRALTMSVERGHRGHGICFYGATADCYSHLTFPHYLSLSFFLLFLFYFCVYDLMLTLFNEILS